MDRRLPTAGVLVEVVSTIMVISVIETLISVLIEVLIVLIEVLIVLVEDHRLLLGAADDLPPLPACRLDEGHRRLRRECLDPYDRFPLGGRQEPEECRLVLPENRCRFGGDRPRWCDNLEIAVEDDHPTACLPDHAENVERGSDHRTTTSMPPVLPFAGSPCELCELCELFPPCGLWGC